METYKHLKSNHEEVKMTSRCWNLYNLLKSNPTKWFTQKEICDAIPEYRYFNRKNDNCPTIREDKLIINASHEVDHLVVMKNYCFKIANEQEYLEEYAMHVRRLKNQAKTLDDMKYKYSRNGQMKIISNKGKVIDEKSKARNFFETFVAEEY